MPTKNRPRRTNLFRILESLWHRSGRSRADLARELHLDRSTVGALVDQMIAAGILYQYGEENSGPRGGRPPILLGIEPNVAYSIGVELTYPTIRLVAVDMCGSYIGGEEIAVEHYGPTAIDTLAVETARLRASLDTRYREHGIGLVTLGVGVSGQVDETNRSIEISHALHVRDPLNIAEPLETVLQVPVSLLNDAQAAVLRESGLRGTGNLLLIIVEFRPGGSDEDIGIGAGLVMRNELCHGKAITHLLRPYFKMLPKDPERSIDELGRSLALVANITGIDEIVLGGDLDGILEPLSERIRRFSRIATDESGSGVRVSSISDGLQAVAFGAAYSSMRFLLADRSFPLFRAIEAG